VNEETTLEGVKWRFSEGEHDDADVRWLLAEVDRLRAQVAAVEDVLEEEDHGLLCDAHYRGPCTCWHAKVAKITGYGYE
jgi:hypothetical protein